MDLDKLKVVDLRKELQQRGLDTKGNKAVLVKRLKDAMDKESDKGSGKTSTAQASGGGGSHNEEEEQSEEEPEEKPPLKEIKTESKEVKSPQKEVKAIKKEVISPRKEEAKPSKKEVKTPEKKPKVQELAESKLGQAKAAKPSESGLKPETNGDQQSGDQKTTDEEDEEGPDTEGKDDEKMETETTSTRGEKRKRDDEDEEDDTETRGEKRRREDKESPEKKTSPEKKASPEKPPAKKREKTPPKEDEPEIDFDKPQLSWYDSDLHLQVDKKSFLSAKPLNEGCMGYIWAGARATHGISSGKVCFEVKITEELKWEDPSKFMHERKDPKIIHRYKVDRRKDKDRSKKDADKKSEKEKDKEEKSKNAEKTEKSEESEEKMETEKSENEENATVEGENENKEEVNEKDDEEEKNAEKEDEEKKTDAEVKESESTEEDKKENEDKMETDQDKEKAEEKPKPDPIPTHYFRVGFSLLGTSLQLGEVKHSFAYESTGKFVTEKEFQEYGVTFGVGDVVGAYLSIDEENVTITYTVNGALQPTAITVPRSEFPEENFALIPHVLCRNYAYELNFGANEEPWFPHPEELKDYQFLQAVEEKVAGPKRPESRGECEVILMIGLPGSGKTTWVKNHVASTTDKVYTVIGNNPIFERMTVDAQPLKSRFGGSWKMLVDKIQKCLNTLTDIASLRRRNFIIDQTNVFPNAQRRKLRAFEGFKRKAVCVICEDEEHARRQKEHENDYGKSVPESTMLDLKAQMELPRKCEWLEELLFTDLIEEEARKKLKQYTEEANKKGYFRRWHPRQDDRRNQRNFRDKRGYGGGRYDRFSQGSWGKSSGSGWGRDRRERGPPPRQDAWRQQSRGPRYLERERPRDSRSGGGYGGGRSGGGRSTDVWQNSTPSSWGTGSNQGGWNAQMYGTHGYGAWSQQGQGGWKFSGNQSGYGGSQSGYGYSQGGYGGSQSGYGSGHGGYGQQNWNYYGQYSQQQGWGNSQQKRN